MKSVSFLALQAFVSVFYAHLFEKNVGGVLPMDFDCDVTPLTESASAVRNVKMKSYL